MELYSSEVAKLKVLLDDWWTHQETELEATFGVKGQVDAQTFLTVATRLRSRGYSDLPQQERLNICLPDHVRFGLVGMGQIQKYCRDDLLVGKPFIAMIKDRAAGSVSNVDIPDYDLRIKSRRELPMAQDDARVKNILGKWNTQLKAFRLIRRWTFEANGVKFDLSMIRSTPKTPKGDFLWVRRFRDKNIMKLPPTYEIEVELERTAFATVDDAYKALLRGVGEVLRGIQKSPLLIRKSTATAVMEDYEKLVGSRVFRGVAPVTLEVQNMVQEPVGKGVYNIRDGYNVTDKADGLRVMPFCNSVGELFLIDMGLNVYRTGLKNPECANSLLDGEWVTKDKEGKTIQQLLLFDIYKSKGGQEVSNLPFREERYPKLVDWVKTWNKDVEKKTGAQLLVSVKTFLFGTKGDTSIFIHAGRILDTEKLYPTDGLIFTPNDAPIPPKAGDTFWSQFKWKPSEDNTIDFLVEFEKDAELTKQDKIVNGIHPSTGVYVQYKVMRLLVGSSKDPAYSDPRTTILFEQPIPKGREEKSDAKYKPILFSPAEFPDTMANVSYRQLEEGLQEEYVTTERSGEPINDLSIVEFRYDPTQPSGWRWIPIRVRTDKTDRFLKGYKKGDIGRTLNSEKVANSVWSSIHEPITETMIRTGTEQPTEKELKTLAQVELVSKKYYDRKAPIEDLQKVRGLRDFHNKWIKDRVLYGSFFKSGPGKTLIDVAVGKAGDLQRWRRGGASFVLGVDTAGENIRDPKDGAYRRYMNTISTAGRESTPTCLFVIGESQKRYIDGDAGVTTQEKDMLRSVFGQFKAEGGLPPYVEKEVAGRLRNKADGITCQFALHYFFKDENTFNGLLANIRDTLKLGGYFFGAAFDGERVFDLLRGLNEGQSRIGSDDSAELWRITKRYEADELPAGSDAFGMPIDVEFISIGLPATEYLIPFGLLVSKLKTIGLELLDETELKTLGLRTSSSTFDISYEMAKANGQVYVMSEAVRQFSFLNRWFIFKRTSEGTDVEGVEGVVESVAEMETREKPITVGETVTVEKEKEGEAESVVVEGGPKIPAVTSTEEAIGQATEAVEVERTVAIAPGMGAPSTLLKTYSPNELFQFDIDSALQDKLKIGDKGAARWLAPMAPFPIPDPEDAAQIYPSMEHYIAGMRLKLASNKRI